MQKNCAQSGEYLIFCYCSMFVVGYGDADTALDAQIDSMIDHLTCLVCGKTASKLQNLRNHVETHVAGAKFSCELCAKQYMTRNSLNVHRSNFHKNANAAT